MNSTVLNKYRKLNLEAKASLWFILCTFIQKGIVVISTPVFTRIMSAAEYGRFGVFNSWMSIFNVFVSMCLSAGMFMRGLVKYDSDRDGYSSSMQGLSTTLLLIWLCLYTLQRKNVNSLTTLSTAQSYMMLILIWTTSAFSFWSAEQRVKLNYKSLIVLTIGVAVLKPLLGIILIIQSSDKVTARIISLVIVEGILYTYCFIDQVRRGHRFYDKYYWHEAIIFCLPLIPHYLSMNILNSADKIMIKNMIGSTEAGIYNLAYQISQVMLILNTAMIQSIEPWLYKQINEDNTMRIRKVAYPAWITVACANLLLICLAPEVVRFFAPKEYQSAIWMIPPVTMSVFFIFLYSFFAVFEFYYKRTKLIAVATCIGAILNLVLNYILIKPFGYMAAGYTTLLCYIIYASMHYLFMRHITKSYNSPVYNIDFILLLSAIFLIGGFLIMLTYEIPLLRYAILTITALIAIIKRNQIRDYIKSTINLKK